ncbi:MAG: DUF2953 domain-containing protein [Clostridiales bacterium]|jgi:hypothetical protein|nr:DUF2953 domain-containing protein [Clostridiales bacterium]
MAWEDLGRWIAEMVALIVIGSILLFFLLLLFCPVTLTASYDQEFRAKLRYLFFTIRLAPPKEKPEGEQPKKKKKPKKEPQEGAEKKPSFSKRFLGEWGLGGFLSLVKEIAKIAIGKGKRLFSHLVISRMTAVLRIGGSDAAAVAAQYGKACAVVYPAFTVLAGNTKCRRHHVWVAPDFTSEKTEIYFDIQVGIRPWFVLTGVIGFAFHALRAYLRKRPKKQAGADAGSKGNLEQQL